MLALEPAALKRTWEALTASDRARLAQYWAFYRHDAQIPPDGPWRVWVFMGGRGAGKTRAGAEWVSEMAMTGAAKRIGLIAASLHEARSVMVEGPSGLLNPTWSAARPRWMSARRLLTWPNGARAELFSAAKPAMLRGPQFDLLWADEFVKWKNPQAVLDMAQMALRLGPQPRMLVTTTPARHPALRALLAGAETRATHAPTGANARHLSPRFLSSLERAYGGSALARQEIGGEILEDDETALFRRAWIDAGRVDAAPKLVRVVVGVDPPVSVGARADACGIVVAGRCAEGRIYVLADATVRGLTPAGWAARVKRAADAHEADAVVVETNQGGALVSDLLRKAGEGAVRVIAVHAGASKRTRAEPVALLYETGRVHHVGALSALEDEMCLFGGADWTGKSPDRVDALVWAVTALSGGAGGPRVRGLG